MTKPALYRSNPSPAERQCDANLVALRDHQRATSSRRVSLYDAARMLIVRGHDEGWVRRWLRDAEAELDHDYDLARAIRSGRFA